MRSSRASLAGALLMHTLNNSLSLRFSFVSSHTTYRAPDKINKTSGGHGDRMAQSHHLCMNYRFGASQAFAQVHLA